MKTILFYINKRKKPSVAGLFHQEFQKDRIYYVHLNSQTK